MKISIAKQAGLCYGVKRALNIARNTRQKKREKVFTLGDLIHNPQVIQELEKQGIHSVENLHQLKKGTVITRSHGISPQVFQLLKRKNLEVVDATCPIVKRIQTLVEYLAKQKEEIIIVGNKEHPETKGLLGYSQHRGIIIENVSQAKSLPHKKKRAVLAQSTQDIQVFREVAATLIEKTREIRIFNTICKATLTNQKSTLELASQVDTIFIVGGKNSSNTTKLYKISKEILTRTYFIEKAEEISPEMIKGAKNIGISGGASTPPEALHKAEEKIYSILNANSREKAAQCQS